MKKAVTLVEILLVVVLSALLMAVIIPFIRSVNDTWNMGSSRTEVLQNGRAALETMTRYIRQAKRITKIPGSPGNYIKIRDYQDTDNIIFYHNVLGSPYYIGDSGIIRVNDLVMRSDSTGSYVDSLLAAGVNSLTFNFFKDDGTPATKANQVKSVQIQMQLSDPLGNTTYTLALEDTVVLRQDVKIISPVWFSHANQVGDLSLDIWVDGFSSPNSVSVNSSTGECWVADTGNNRVLKLSSSGTILWISSPGLFSSPESVSVNPAIDPAYGQSGVCWVADTGNNCIKKVSSNGAILLNLAKFGKEKFKSPHSISVNWLTGDCWVGEGIKSQDSNIKKVKSDGSALLVNLSGFNIPRFVSADPTNDNCWVADTGGNRIRRVYLSGSTWTYENIPGAYSSPRSVAVNPGEIVNGRSTCWVANTGGNQVRKIYWAGSSWTYITITGFSGPYSVSVNTSDVTCWVADTGNNRIVRLNSAGDIEFDIKGFNSPLSVSASP